MKSINKLLFSVFIGVIATIYVFTITSPVKASSGAVCVDTHSHVKILNSENNVIFDCRAEYPHGDPNGYSVIPDIYLQSGHGYVFQFWFDVVDNSYCDNDTSNRYKYISETDNKCAFLMVSPISGDVAINSVSYAPSIVNRSTPLSFIQSGDIIATQPMYWDLSCDVNDKNKYSFGVGIDDCSYSEASYYSEVWFSFENYGDHVLPGIENNTPLDFNIAQYCGYSYPTPTPGLPACKPTSTPAPTNTPTPTPTVVYTPRPTSTPTPTPTQESIIEDENIVYVEEEQGDLTIENLNGSDITSVVDFAVENSFGEISFNTNIDFSKDEDKLNELNKYISISQGKVEVDTDSLVGLKDVPATITLKGLSFRFTPIILVDGHEDTDHIVSNIRYNPDTGVLVFDVKHFTTFEAVASPKEQESTTVTPVMTNTQEENQSGQQAVDSSVSDIKAKYSKYSRIMIALAIIAVILIIAVIVKELRAKNSSDE